MATAWLTYAWADNDDGDVNFVTQQLRSAGLKVLIDRQHIRAGIPLWDQIDSSISDRSLCDAWIIYATASAFASKSCREELAYALDRALKIRGEDFPLIGLFPSTVPHDLIPGPIRVRLYVSLTDPHWEERIIASCEGRDPRIDLEKLSPYQVTVHANAIRKGNGHSIEIRPRAGSWSRFLAAIPLGEQVFVNPSLFYGARGEVPRNSIIQMSCRGPDTNNDWWIMSADNEATPTMSYYLNCDNLPTEIVFGKENGQNYRVRIQ